MGQRMSHETRLMLKNIAIALSCVIFLAVASISIFGTVNTNNTIPVDENSQLSQGDTGSEINAENLESDKDEAERASDEFWSDKEMVFSTNLSGPADYGTEWPFNDIMKLSREWLTTNNQWVDGGINEFDTQVIDKIPKDADGYPMEVPYIDDGLEAPQVVFTVWANTFSMKQGRYTLLYDGEGIIEFDFDAKVISSEAGKMIIEINPKDNIAAMYIRESKKDNHIRNIRIYLPDADVDKIFNKDWIEKLEVFKTLRFMDWGKTNMNDIVNWEDRPQIDDYTYTTNYGIPYEIMIEAANTANKDMWICVPHKANDEYIRNLAIMIRDNLKPELKVYVEYSNEVWNWMFDQTTYCYEEGDQSVEWPERIVPYIQNTLDIFSEVFADDMDRLERVVAVQHGWIDVSNRIASNMRAGSFDILSPAAYFGITEEGYVKLEQAGDSADVELLAELAKEHIDTEAYPLMLEQAEIANRLGVKMAFYEGGQHLTPNPFGSEQPYGKALVDIQNDVAIYEIYFYWFDLLSSIEITNSDLPIEFVNFTLASGESERYGTWGVFSNIFEQEISIETAPKYQAIIDFINGED